MFQKLFRKNTESVDDANSQKDYFYLICALFHRGLPDMAKSQIQTAKNYLTEDEYSD